MTETCGQCNGSGEGMVERYACPNCKGKGAVEVVTPEPRCSCCDKPVDHRQFPLMVGKEGPLCDECFAVLSLEGV